MPARTPLYQWECVTCRQSLGCDDPTADLLLMWNEHHHGHQIEEHHQPENDAVISPAP